MKAEKQGLRPIKRVLIANRGEIALRIIRTLKELDIESIAIFSAQDRYSRHCSEASFALELKGTSNPETYLNSEQIIQAAIDAKACAIHPGYGFLSENPDFCRACEEAGLIFIGPSSQSMQTMGDKISARALMRQKGIPIVPGSLGAISSIAELDQLSHEIGFPLILKAAAGGGGRGMRIVRKNSELAESLAACQREAIACFGSDAVFCERYIDNPRHIEIQVLFDKHGQGVHLFERDCSIQRRQQKLFEEAPSSYLNVEQRERLGALAIEAAKAANYTGAGTVEFICESASKAYFMEMNTRIQVEHPVTEAITGIDLIAAQIQIASGQEIGLNQEELQINGWSMEARINAEDPSLGFTPSPGLITDYRPPSGPFVRVDSHIYSGYTVPGDYDSMIAKIIVWGRTREEARQRLLRALGELVIDGISSSLEFQEALLKHPEFVEATFDTGFIARESQYFTDSLKEVTPDKMQIAALAAALSLEQCQQRKNPQVSKSLRKSWQARAKVEQHSSC